MPLCREFLSHGISSSITYIKYIHRAMTQLLLSYSTLDYLSDSSYLISKNVDNVLVAPIYLCLEVWLRLIVCYTLNSEVYYAALFKRAFYSRKFSPLKIGIPYWTRAISILSRALSFLSRSRPIITRVSF